MSTSTPQCRAGRVPITCGPQQFRVAAMPTSLQTNRLLGRAAAAFFFLAAAAVPAHATVTASIVGTELRVAGDAAADAITVRLVTADTTRVEVLQGAAPVGNFLRSLFTTIAVDAGGGDDTVLIDEINGAFTDTETTTISGGDGNDTITGGNRRPDHPGRARQRHDQLAGRQRRAVRRRRRRPVHLEPRRRQRHCRGAGRDRHAGVPRQRHRRDFHALAERRAGDPGAERGATS